MSKTKRLYGKDESYLKLYQLDTGYQFASRKAKPIVEGNDKADAVVVIAHDNDGRLLLIHEWRPVIGQFLWSFPAGLIDEGEDAFTAAGREVKEETGLHLMVDPDDLHYFNNTYACPGMCDEKVAIVEGTVYGELSKEYQEKSENITPYLMDFDDMATAGFFTNHDVHLQSWVATYLMA